MPTRHHRFATTIEEFLGEIQELKDFIFGQAKLLDVGMGVIDRDGAVARLWPINFKKICQLVRRSPEGQQACEECDRLACESCQRKPRRKTVAQYRERQCHMRLIDLPAPIFVHNRLLAHLFVGQIRWKELEGGLTAFLRKRHRELELEKAGVQLSDLLGAYKDLRVRGLAEIQQIDDTLLKLANAIGVFAEYVDVLHSINELSSKLMPSLDMESGLHLVFKTASRLFDANDGSIWLAYRKGAGDNNATYSTVLRPVELHWLSDEENKEWQARLEIPVGQGLVGWIADKRKTRSCCTPEELAEIPAGHPGLRDCRRLRSLIGTPVMAHGSLVGVIELGFRKKMLFDRGDEQLLEILGRVAGNFVRRTKERHLLTEINDKQSVEEVFRFLEQELPPLFGALAVTVFKPQTDHNRVWLVPAFPETIIAGRGPGSQSGLENLRYDLEAGEGFTGWVGKYLTPLRVKDGHSGEEALTQYKQGKLLGPDGKPPLLPPVWAGKTLGVTEPTEEIRRPLRGALLLYPVVDTSGRLLAVVRVADRGAVPFTKADETFLRDICKQAALCLQKLSRQGEEARQRMARLVTLCTHDFIRDIHLASSSTTAALEALRKYQTSRAVEEVERARGAITHLWQYVETLSEAYRTGKAARFPQPVPVSLVRAVKNAIDAREDDCQRSPRPIALRLEGKLERLEDVCVNVLPEEIEANLCSILGNSIEAIRRSKCEFGVITIRLQCTPDENKVIVEVLDNGSGFHDEALACVMAGRVLPVQLRFGSGIALQECKDFVEGVLHGEFSICNSEGGGACVSWVVPVERVKIRGETHESAKSGSAR